MTNARTTKRALLASIMALLLCFTMLLGTTYAWFTDSVASANNIIKTGNLDVVLEIGTLKDTADPANSADPANWDWTEVDSTTKIFKDYELYEPGYVETVALRVRNNGSLSFKYNLATVIAAEKEGLTKNGDPIKLSEYLKVVSAPSLAYTNYSRSILMGLAKDTISASGIGAAVCNLNELISEDVVLNPGQSTLITLAIVMPDDVGNEANHDGNNRPEITLGVTVVATQYTEEEDSFGKDYDVNAEYPDHVVSDLAGLKTAFADGGSIQLTADIDVPATLRVEPGVAVNLDLNGKTITVPDDSTSSAFNSLFYAENGSDITISGNGTVDLGENGMSLVVTRGNVTIENGTFIRKVTDPSNAYPLISDSKYADGNGTTVINGGYFDGGYYDANAADIEELLAGTKTLTETADDIAKRGNSGDKNLVRVALKDNITGTLNLSKSTFKVYGGTFVGVNPAWGDEGAMLPTTPNYLRPWSYYQGALLDGQTFNENGIVLPEGYTITRTVNADGVPVYTVEYNK